MTMIEVLSTLLPSIDELNELLVSIRKKYDIPEVRPEQMKMVEELKSDKFYDWKAVRQDIEIGLRKFFQIALVETGLDKWLQFFRDLIGSGPQVKAILTSPGINVNETVADGFVEALNKNAVGGLNLMDQFYIKASEKLLEHLRTGRPIEVPAELFNLILTVQIPKGDEKIVIAVAHGMNDPDEMAEEFYKKMVDTFPEKPKLTERDLETAEYLSMKNRHKPLEEITDIDVARHPEAIPGIEDYDVEFKNHTATLNRRMIRLQDKINRIAGSDKK